MAMRMVHNPKVAHLYKGAVDKDGWTNYILYRRDQYVYEQLAKLGNKPKKVFIGSMTDCFHHNVTLKYILEVIKNFADIKFSHHTFIMLTKRPKRMHEVMNKLGYTPNNLWLGVTVCNQREADEKIPILLQTPAAKRFVSVEPMLGEIDLSRMIYIPPSPDWIICGGETGHGARPMHPDWVRSLRDQCIYAGTPFFFKSWGHNMPCDAAPSLMSCMSDDMCSVCNGHLIDGVEWHQFPEVGE
jgi:protein gp37